MFALAKAAILIDGGYFLKRLPTVRPDVDAANPAEVVEAIRQLVRSHLRQLNEVYHCSDSLQLLHRCFYYDAMPYGEKAHQPISKKSINYATSNIATFRNALVDALRKEHNFALRLGQVIRPDERSWILKSEPQKRLLNGDLEVSQLKDSDFSPNLRQKGVDMRIGLDIATISLKKLANIIVLVSGDSDFVQAAKLARREGATVILDPLWQNIPSDLSEHVDKVTSGFSRPRHGSPTADGEG